MSDFDITFNQPGTAASYIDVLARGPEKVNRGAIVSGVIDCEIDLDESPISIESRR